MRKGLNMKKWWLWDWCWYLWSHVRESTTTDATCCAANGEGNCPKELAAKNARTHVILTIKKNKTMAYSKKYTNADFYKDGKFQQDVAMEAMKDMFAFYGVPFTELMAKDMWVTDFGWVILKTWVWVVFSGSTILSISISLTLSICCRAR